MMLDVRNDPPILTVTGLRIRGSATGEDLVKDVSFALERGGTMGIVGESGSGKTLTCRALLGILPPGIEIAAGTLVFDGHSLTALAEKEWRRLRGTRVAAVFQDPASYLNPSLPVGRQLQEVLRIKRRLARRVAKAEALELFRSVGLHNADRVYGQYPHELSGGMLQRILIAIALAEEPDLLIADEATTALDVTVQAEILDLLADLRERYGLSLILVSHDLAVVSQVCEQVLVFRDGVIVERGGTPDVLSDPQHRYTQALLAGHNEYGIERFLPERVDA
jgi:ABC-type glutathione transport system ATPase component